MRRLVVAVALVVTATGCAAHASRPAHPPFASSSAPRSSRLHVVGRIPLPGGNSRLDYASLDARRGLLFVTHLGASQVAELNVRTDGTVWTTNESGGSETIIDAATGMLRGTVRLGGEAGNVAYDPASDHMLVAVQSRNQLAVIDPITRAVIRRVPLPGCEDDHGLALDSPARLAFVACDINSALLTVDLNTWRVTGTAIVGVEPDVLAFDPNAGLLYVAAESGWVTVLRHDGHRLRAIYSNYLAKDAHVVAVDPATGRSYFPVLSGSGGHPAVLVCEIS